VSTALAGVLLGLKMIYLEAGSGALNPVSESMISAVRDAIPAPLMVGGGIRTPEQAAAAWRAGADLVVVGNALERDPEMILKIRQQCA
jgi:putative glycerol-1-phosphate prenyltransferase